MKLTRAFSIPAGVIAVVLSFAIPVSNAATVEYGSSPNSANAIPFNIGNVHYQQVYSASLFPAVLAIDTLTFFETGPDSATISTGAYNILLSTTSAAPDALSATFTDNLGVNTQTFFTGPLGSGTPVSTSFSITGIPYTYNPLLGNLLIDVTIQGVTSIGSGFLDAVNITGDASSRLFRIGGPPFLLTGSTDTIGLRTQFSGTVLAAIPEPSTYALMIAGLGLVAFVAGRRRKSQLPVS